MDAVGAFAIKCIRAPINLTSDIIGRSGALFSGVATEWVQLAEALHGIEAIAPGADRNRIILYFHGGGHWLLTANAYREFIGRLSLATQARVVAVDYSKPPAACFPAGLDDALAAWRWATAQPKASVAVAGDSSGGNLAFALVVRLAQLGEPQPVSCVGISPWLRLDMTSSLQDAYGNFCTNLYLGSQGQRTTSPDDPLVSPVNAGELAHRFPPVLMHAGSNELTTEDVKEMAAVLEGAGRPAEVKLYSAPHIFQVMPGFPESTRDSLLRISTFLAQHWQGGADGVH